MPRRREAPRGVDRMNGDIQWQCYTITLRQMQHLPSSPETLMRQPVRCLLICGDEWDAVEPNGFLAAYAGDVPGLPRSILEEDIKSIP